MKAQIVVESMFGNTSAVARAVAEGLREHLPADLVPASDPTSVGEQISLLVLGGPTHAFGMSRPSTRESAEAQGAPQVPRGIREWIEDLPRLEGRDVAAFDTHVAHPDLPGSAAHGATRRLHHLGGHVLLPPMSFHVSGTTGPLLAGELERARTWGSRLGAEHASRTAGALRSPR